MSRKAVSSEENGYNPHWGKEEVFKIPFIETTDMVKIIIYGYQGNGNVEAIAGYPYQVYKLTLNELPHITEWFHLKVNDRVSATIFIDVILTWVKQRP